MSTQPTTGVRVCAIFGDIVGSRGVPDRNELQKTVATLLPEVNSRFADAIIAPFRIIAGDEVRGLLRDESKSYEIVSFFEDALLPHRMRFAVGIGEVTTELSDDVNMVDGPALHRATAAMAVLKNRKRAHGRAVLYSSDDPERDRVLNTLAFGIASIKGKWSRDDREKVGLLFSGHTLDEVGETIGISHQAVAKLASKLNYYAVAEAEELLNDALCNQIRLQR